jgi:hypothetical protein
VALAEAVAEQLSQLQRQVQTVGMVAKVEVAVAAAESA